ncbi:MAG TPA: sodium:proton antiporter [Acetobacteraceae bacterium]|nr:sodium:proton antiporter [Acetobacteraceae bacterium]
MSRFDLLALLLVNTALAALINKRLLRLQPAIGLLVVSLFISGGVILLARVFGATAVPRFTEAVLGLADLPHVLLDGALGFLLFAAASQVDIEDLRPRIGTVLALASVGVILATMFYGGAMWGVFRLAGTPVPLGWCVVLGAILAPTDPVAVTGILQRMNLPRALQHVIVGESLFNDGFSIVAFSVALTAASGDLAAVTPGGIVVAFAREGLGGALLGVAAGALALAVLRLVDDYHVELMISLATVTATYAAARHLEVSGPIAVVVAGLLIRKRAKEGVMSDITRRNLSLFWSLIDNVLNGLLFLLIGLEMVVIKPEPHWPAIVAAGIILAVVVRFVSTAIPAVPLNLQRLHHLRSLAILTWGGLRGGVSVALALSLPASPYRDALLGVCYGVVVFTIIGQGLTMPWLIRTLFGNE